MNQTLVKNFAGFGVRGCWEMGGEEEGDCGAGEGKKREVFHLM